MKAKYTANWGVQVVGMFFQTHSRYKYSFHYIMPIIRAKDTAYKKNKKLYSRVKTFRYISSNTMLPKLQKRGQKIMEEMRG